MHIFNFVVPGLLTMFTSGRDLDLQDAEVVTVISSITITEDAALTVSELVDGSTEAVVVENVTVTATRFCDTTTTSVYTTRSTSTSISAPAPSATDDHAGGYIVTAYSPETPINGLHMQAAGFKLWLGGEPAAYCPEIVREIGACPRGNVTTINVCAMAVSVPGGQAIYATADGQITYTTAHSTRFSNPRELDARCPFAYEWTGGQYGELRAASWAFGADSLMACPAAESSWQVVLSLSNATVPSGNVSDCIKFDALTVNVTEPGAWQYN